ncbi:hypothetical protein CFAM422_002815 [Trichoderma lentiforme]|uniref:Uncharacterized protein n=1 Tax=Trichoderma lentiforme TaxID=1567552 RepID=A0A9P4XN43_9HYPO|nr:hypothetical protein CFAM422_002815 [Trichoderma lentiforme]
MVERKQNLSVRHRGCVASFFFGRTASNSGGQIKVYWFLFCFVLLCTTIFIQTMSILKTPATMTREHRSSRTTTNLSVCVFVCLVWFGFSKLHPGKSSAMRADLFCYVKSIHVVVPSYDRVVFFVSWNQANSTPIPIVQPFA